MKIKLLLIASLTCLSFSNLLAQGLTGRAYYKSSSSFRFEMDSSKMAPEQMAEIQAQLKKQMEREYVLSFNPIESNWKQVESLGGGPATASSGGSSL